MGGKPEPPHFSFEINLFLLAVWFQLHKLDPDAFRVDNPGLPVSVMPAFGLYRQHAAARFNTLHRLKNVIHLNGKVRKSGVEAPFARAFLFMGTPL